MIAIDGDKVTIPTPADVTNSAYGFSSYCTVDNSWGTLIRYDTTSTRMAMPSNLGDAGAKLGENDVNWWLRYSGYNDNKTSCKDTSTGGEVYIDARVYSVNSKNIYVRPMIKIKLDESVKYVGTFNVDGEDVPYIGKRITYNFFSNPQSVLVKNKLKVSVKTPYAYTGKQIKPAVTVKFNGKTLSKGKDYTLSYGKNVAVGTGTVTVKSTGTRFDSVKKTFTIILAKVTCVKAKSTKSKKVTVSWSNKLGKKAAVTGYKVVLKSEKSREDCHSQGQGEVEQDHHCFCLIQGQETEGDRHRIQESQREDPVVNGFVREERESEVKKNSATYKMREGHPQWMPLFLFVFAHMYVRYRNCFLRHLEATITPAIAATSITDKVAIKAVALSPVCARALPLSEENSDDQSKLLFFPKSIPPKSPKSNGFPLSSPSFFRIRRPAI